MTTEKKYKRNDAIPFDVAREKFIEFYEKSEGNNRTTDIGKMRAKIFDMMYQKKPKYTIRCNTTEDPKTITINKKDKNTNEIKEESIILEPGMCEPGSARYLLEAGPRTFDVEGLDWFVEDEDTLVWGKNKNNVKVRSRGATYKKSEDEHIDGDVNDQSPQIYGPRLSDNTLYSKHFGEKYNATVDNQGLGKDHLIKEYWKKYNEFKESGKLDDNPMYKRKNKKKDEEEIIPEDVIYDLDTITISGIAVYIEDQEINANDQYYWLDTSNYIQLLKKEELSPMLPVEPIEDEDFSEYKQIHTHIIDSIHEQGYLDGLELNDNYLEKVTNFKNDLDTKFNTPILAIKNENNEFDNLFLIKNKNNEYHLIFQSDYQDHNTTKYFISDLPFC